MNLHVITTDDLRKSQIENYTELLKNSKSEKQIKFLEQQITLLSGNSIHHSKRSIRDNISRVLHIPDSL